MRLRQRLELLAQIDDDIVELGVLGLKVGMRRPEVGNGFVVRDDTARIGASDTPPLRFCADLRIPIPRCRGGD